MKLTSSATSLALLLIASNLGACGDSASTEPTVEAIRCQGINECAGTGECSSPDGANDCQGHNECAGQGWVTVESEEACTDAGGTVLA